uniref:Phosphate uptake regulator PhoU n=1 Tax=Ignisphaera aggregans TaxID=334771 RepID=A0A7J2U542_9CREN
MSMSKVVETRKVQKFGKSTLMVSLPSEWVKFVDLRPSDLVVMEVRDDGSLIIVPQKLAEKGVREREAKIIVSKNTSEALLQRTIYTLYIVGYDKIAIECSDEFLPPQLISSIRAMVRMLIGSEIIEQAGNRIVIQNFVDTERYSVDSLVQRMVSTIKSMLEHLIASIKEGSLEHLKEVTELEFEMDRVHALAIRYVYVLNMQKGSQFITEYRVLITTLEDIGDALAQSALILSEKSGLIDVAKSIISERLEELKMHLEYTLDIVLQAIVREDPYIASRAADLATEAMKFVSRLEAEAIPIYKSTDEYLHIKSFFEKFMVMCYSMQATAEVVFDIVVSRKGGMLDISKGF